MPSRYVVRNYVEDGIYHIYNKSAEDLLYKDDQDYRVFLFYLLIYTSPKESVKGKYPDLPFRLESKNLHDDIKILGYCLMPSHFHLLIQQKTRNAISKLMKQIINGYTLYFNQKYQRRGSLMQGRYKAAKIENKHVTQIWRYIHLNPMMENISEHPIEYKWSSYKFFMGEPDEIRIDQMYIQNFFKNPMEIEKFHTDRDDYQNQLSAIKEIVIEEFK